MKNIIPFKKEVIFKTNISEITSISLEHTLSLENDKVQGNFIVNGEYKVSDSSTTVETFNLELPFEIIIDEKYDTKRAIIDIDDFYYEIVNNNVLSISIDVLIDKLEEKPIIEDFTLIDETPNREIIEEEITENEKEEVKEEAKTDKKRCIDESEKEEYEKKKEEIKDMINEKEEPREVEEKINSLFNQFSKDSEVYVTYNVYILRDSDTLESILEKYNITEDTLKEYNDLSDLKIGDKIIIPTNYEGN